MKQNITTKTEIKREGKEKRGSEKIRGKLKEKGGTSLVNDVQGTMDDVVKLEGIVGIGEALYIERIVLVSDHRDAHDHLLRLLSTELRQGFQA